MFYSEYFSSGLLSHYVDCYWLHKQDSTTKDFREQSCLPLGTVELIIQVNQHPSHHLNVNGVWVKSNRIFFAGFYNHAVVWKVKPDSVMFGVRLKPESLIQLFNVPASLLSNSLLDAEAVLGLWVKFMADEMCGITDAGKLICIAEKYLLNCLAKVAGKDNSFTSACRLIRMQDNNLSIEQLSNYLNVSKRQLERVFKDQLGTSPKTYQRIVRFTKAYNYMQNNKHINWADITYDTGFADQSHFIRDFKEFTGFAPTDFVAQKQLYAPKVLSVKTGIYD